MSFLPIVVEMYLKPLGTEREKWVSPALPCTAGKLSTHSPLSISSQESSLPAHSAPHCSVSRRVRVPLTLSSALKLIFFFSSGRLNHSPGSLDFQKACPICGCLPKSVLSRFSPTMADRLGLVRWLLLFLQPIPSSIWLLPRA